MTFFEKLLLKDIRLTGKIILFFFLGLAILVYLIHGLMGLSFRYPLDYGEGPLLNQAVRITQRKPLYPADLSIPPYLILNYPPVFPLITAFFSWLFNPGLLIGRIIAFVSTLGSAFVIGLIIKQITHSKGILPLLMGAAVFLINPFVLQWSILFRIDMLAVFLSLMGILFVLRNPYQKKNIVIGAIFFISAVYTRQSFAIAAPLGAAIYTILKAKKQAIRLILIFSVGSLFAFAILQVLTEGGFFFHIITANVNPFSWLTVWHYAQQLIAGMPVLLILSLLFLAAGWLFNPAYAFLAPYLLGAILTALTIGKVGSNVNYLVEVCAGIAVITGVSCKIFYEPLIIDPEQNPALSLPRELTSKSEIVPSAIRKKLWGNLAIFSLFSALMVYQIAGLTRQSLLGPIIRHRDRTKKGNAYVAIVGYLQDNAQNGPILADEYMAMLPSNQIDIYFEPFEMTQLANAGLWDQSSFINSITKKEFPLILMHHFPFYPVYMERWTPEMRQAIYSHYIAKDMRADTLIFQPKDTNNYQYPENLSCSGAIWRLPTQADMGMFWYNRQLIMLGAGLEGEVPVFAVADGRLYQFPEWENSVAIQHQDPHDPEKTIWSYYGGLAPNRGENQPFIEEISINSISIAVNAGDLIGYQGRWLGPNLSTWVHLRFALIPSEADRTFPEVFLPIDDFNARLPSLRDQINLGLRAPISIKSLLGLPESDIFGTMVFLPFECYQD